MKTVRYILIALMFSTIFIGCEDLEVENLNDPDFETAFSNPADIKGVTGGLINSWFQINQEADAVGIALWTHADAGTCSWGNFGMRDFGNEPRLEFNNTPAYSNALITENYYNTINSILSQSNDVLTMTINNGVEMEDGSTPLVNATAYFIQGVTLGYLGLIYDQAYITTHESDLLIVQEPKPYSEVLAAAIKSLDECIKICDENSFSVPTTWIPGYEYDNESFGALANSMAARILACGPRNKAEDATVDWTSVYNYAKNGIEVDFAPLADDIQWYSLYQTYPVYPGWGQIDMYVINLMDPNMPAEFPTSGDFADLPNDGEATSLDARLVSDFEYLSSCPFRAERGYYHYSSYRYARLDQYITTWTEPMPVFRVAENDYLLAEAAVHTNKVGEAADVLNASARSTRGELADVAADETAVLDAIHYERMVELMLSGMGIQFFQMRKSELLQKGSIHHFPIPGSQLDVLQKENYTFGPGKGVAGTDYSNGGWK